MKIFNRKFRNRDLVFKLLFLIFYLGAVAYYFPVLLTHFLTWYIAVCFVLAYNSPVWLDGLINKIVNKLKL